MPRARRRPPSPREGSGGLPRDERRRRRGPSAAPRGGGHTRARDRRRLPRRAASEVPRPPRQPGEHDAGRGPRQHAPGIAEQFGSGGRPEHESRRPEHGAEITVLPKDERGEGSVPRRGSEQPGALPVDEPGAAVQQYDDRGHEEHEAHADEAERERVESKAFDGCPGEAALLEAGGEGEHAESEGREGGVGRGELRQVKEDDLRDSQCEEHEAGRVEDGRTPPEPEEHEREGHHAQRGHSGMATLEGRPEAVVCKPDEEANMDIFLWPD